MNFAFKMIYFVRTGETVTEAFDAVMVCTGHHSVPNIPEFPGAETFKGEVLHSHEYKDNERFRGKRVVTVGIGNSSSDITTEISKVAAECFCVSRSGVWVQLNGFGDAELLESGEEVWGDGKPFALSRMEILRQGWSGEEAISREMQAGLSHQEWVNVAPDDGLEPQMRIGQAHPTQTLNNPSNNLLKQLCSGKIRIKTGLERLTETGAVFAAAKGEEPVDCVVLCTGWIFGFEFVDKRVWPEKCGDAEHWQRDNENTLFKFMYPTSGYNNIAWVGLCQPLHSQFLVSEIMSRHALATFTGEIELPPMAEQLSDIAEKRDAMRVQFKDSPRHTMMANVALLDELAEDLSVTPTLGRLLQTMNWRKIRAAYWTPMTANHYRLVGPDSRDDAAQIIWDEYKGIYHDASNRTYGSIAHYLLWQYPSTFLRFLPKQIKNRMANGKLEWNPLV